MPALSPSGPSANAPGPACLTRRAFLHSGARGAAGLAALSAPANSSAATTPAGGWIDAHVHLWSADTARYPLAEGFTRQKDMVPGQFEPEQLLTHTAAAGVERVVLIQMSFYRFDNSYMLDVLERRPGVFRGVAIIDPAQAPPGPVMRELAARGVRGFRLYADKAAVESWPDSPRMQAMWKSAADQGLALCLLANPDALPGITALCSAHPQTRVVIDHFARIGMKTGSPEDLERLRRLADFPHTYVKTSAFYALGQKRPPYTDLAPMVRALRDSFGAERLLWGSDAPYQVNPGHTYADSIALIRERLDFLTTSERAHLLRGTAEKLFFR